MPDGPRPPFKVSGDSTKETCAEPSKISRLRPVRVPHLPRAIRATQWVRSQPTCTACTTHLHPIVSWLEVLVASATLTWIASDWAQRSASAKNTSISWCQDAGRRTQDAGREGFGASSAADATAYVPPRPTLFKSTVASTRLCTAHLMHGGVHSVLETVARFQMVHHRRLNHT